MAVIESERERICVGKGRQRVGQDFKGGEGKWWEGRSFGERIESEWRCKSKGRDGEKFRLGIRKWEGGREPQEGRERGKRRERYITRFTLTYAYLLLFHPQ